MPLTFIKENKGMTKIIKWKEEETEEEKKTRIWIDNNIFGWHEWILLFIFNESIPISVLHSFIAFTLSSWLHDTLWHGKCVFD